MIEMREMGMEEKRGKITLEEKEVREIERKCNKRRKREVKNNKSSNMRQ